MTSPPLSLQALFCHVPVGSVLTMHDVSNIWRVPCMMEEQGAHHVVIKTLGLTVRARGAGRGTRQGRS